MMNFKIIDTALIILFMLYAPNFQTRESDSSSTVQPVDINGSSMSDALGQVARQFRVVVGFEDVTSPPYDKLVTIHLAHATASETFDAIVKADQRFGWSQVSIGVFHVFKKGETPALPSVIVKTFAVDNLYRREISKLFDKLPEISNWLKDNTCTRSEAIAGSADPWQDDNKKVSLNARGKALSEILDEVSKRSGAYYWSVVRFGQGTCRISIRI
jgi:hypothetical protein